MSQIIDLSGNTLKIDSVDFVGESALSVTSDITGEDTVDATVVLASINALENKVNAILGG